MRDAKRKRRTVAEYGPDPVDVHVGGRVRLRRTLLGTSQMQLADALELFRVGRSALSHLTL